MKRSRPLSLFLSVLFLIFLFPIISLGASDNLISSDLTTWTDWSELQDGAADVSVTTKNGIYRITANPIEGYETYLGVVFDHSKLIAGHSYTLSFKMPILSEINSAFNKDYTQSIIDNHFSKCYVQIGIGFISASGSLNVPDDLILFKIEPDNYTKFFGKSLNTSFIASNYSGAPVVFVSISSLNDYDHSFYFSNFKLVDNDDNSAELTGIKGFLHSIRWDLVGGTCAEEDCPHSSAGNPHLSLSERMSSGFASMFQTIGDKFEEGSTLNTWFTNLANKVGNLDGSLSNLGDRFKGFIDGLSEDLTDNLDGFKSSFTTKIADLKSSWSTWITELKQKFADVGDSITNKFQEIGDKFSEFFDKFKPRVSISFKWSKGSLNSNTGALELNNKMNACVTDYFEVLDNPYYIEFHKSSGDFISGFYFKYDLEHNYISYTYIQPDSEPLMLEPGYCYRFRLYRGDDVSELYGDNLSKVCNELIVVYAEEGWINALLYNMKNFVTNFFNGFGNLILYFNWDGDYTNPFEREDSPIDKVSEFFDDLIEYVDSIGTSIENVLDSITGGLHIFDEFTSRFPWLKGIAMFCLAIIVLSRFIGL